MNENENQIIETNDIDTNIKEKNLDCLINILEIFKEIINQQQQQSKDN